MYERGVVFLVRMQSCVRGKLTLGETFRHKRCKMYALMRHRRLTAKKATRNIDYLTIASLIELSPCILFLARSGPRKSGMPRGNQLCISLQ